MDQTLMDLNTELLSTRLRLENWLFEKALPLWAKGVDETFGGFYERINLDATPDNVNRRTRVAARQVYSFALAKNMGYDKDVSKLIKVGLDWLYGPAKRDDGYFNAVLSPKGEVVDDRFCFYDHAFILLALGSAFGLNPQCIDLKQKAITLRNALITDYSHPLRGFEEAIVRTLPLKANPHMHMFEASLAWIEADGDQVWKDLADMIARLSIDKFIDFSSGVLREFFDGSWSPIEGEQGRIVEPGHLFEWAWLLLRWAKICGDNRYIAVAKRLVEVGETFGVDQGRGVAINEIWDNFKPKDSNARLWPQTERMKAYIALSQIATTPQEHGHYLSRLSLATKGLELYLSTPIEGLYRDNMNADGSFKTESAPASSLYHIICAIEQLRHIGVYKS